MIERVITLSRISEVDWVTKRVIGAYKNTTLNSDQYSNRIFKDLEVLSTDLTKAINPQKALSELEDKDGERDNRVRSLYFTLKSELLNLDPAVSDAAERLMKIFKSHGLAILEENYAMQSSFIKSMLDNYSTKEMQDAIALVPAAKGKVLDVKNAQADFDAASVAYGEAKGAERNMESASKIKDKVMELLNGILVPYLGSVAKLEGGQFADFAQSVNQYISQNNEIVRKRQKKGGSSDE